MKRLFRKQPEESKNNEGNNGHADQFDRLSDSFFQCPSEIADGIACHPYHGDRKHGSKDAEVYELRDIEEPNRRHHGYGYDAVCRSVSEPSAQKRKEHCLSRHKYKRPKGKAVE